MDTFIDKLAQKLTAQDMINANSAADAAELTRLREQMAEYEDLLKDIQDENEKGKNASSCMERCVSELNQSTSGLTQSASLMEQQVSGLTQSASLMEQQVSGLNSHIGQMNDATAAIRESVEEIRESAADMKESTAGFGDGIMRLNESATNIGDGVIQLNDQNFRLGEGVVRLENSTSKLEQTVERSEKTVSAAAQTVVRAEQSVTKAEQGYARTDELIRTAMAKIEKIQADHGSTEELKDILTTLQKAQTEQFNQLADHVHKENVKVYRNVQAVVVEENDKQNENNGKGFGFLSGRVNMLLVVSLVSLLASCAGLVFQILVYLHIL